LWATNYQQVLTPSGKQVPEGTHVQLTYVVHIDSAETYAVNPANTGAAYSAWYNMTACSLRINTIPINAQGIPPLSAPYQQVWAQNLSGVTNPTQNYTYPASTVFGQSFALYANISSEEVYNGTPVTGLLPSFPDLIRVTLTIDMIMPSNDVTFDFLPSFDQTKNGYQFS